MPIKTSEKVISKKPHGAFMLDLGRIFRCVWFRWYDSAGFPIDSEEGQEWLFQKVFADQVRENQC